MSWSKVVSMVCQTRHSFHCPTPVQCFRHVSQLQLESSFFKFSLKVRLLRSLWTHTHCFFFNSFVRETMESTGTFRNPLAECTPPQKRANSLPANIIPKKLVKVQHFPSKLYISLSRNNIFSALGKTEFNENRNIHFLFYNICFSIRQNDKFFFSFCLSSIEDSRIQEVKSSLVTFFSIFEKKTCLCGMRWIFSWINCYSLLIFYFHLWNVLSILLTYLKRI